MSDTPPDPASVKYEATPKDQARTYQTGGAQHITEYHYHGPPPSPPTRSASRSMRMLLAAGLAVVLGGGGVALWAFGPWQSARNDQGTTAAKVSSSPSPSFSPSKGPTAEAKDTAPPPAARSEPTSSPSPSGAAAPPPEASPPSSPSPQETQADDCRGRTTAEGVTVDVCVRREGTKAYMVYELTGTETPRLVDVYMWLEETATKKVVDYVAATDQPYGWHDMRAELTPLRREHVVEVRLMPGTSYEVCVGVVPRDAPVPQFRSPNVGGIMHSFVY
ncbi:hypothetical protein ACIGO6_21960 [Streptomyces sp. NPDC053750]|uniref:hypothetical protein n=1 Tax=Streptomyces sp. NPDC053750 TaxID=3365714 RepID=UPI0037D47B74